MLKLSKLMGALILAVFLQDAQDAQDVLKAPTAAAAAAESIELRKLIVEQKRLGLIEVPPQRGQSPLRSTLYFYFHTAGPAFRS